MALAQRKHYTLSDIYALPDGQRAELIDGEFYAMAPPSRLHQQIAGEIYRQIANHIAEHKGHCKPFIAPFAVFLSEDDKNYVEPDISVVCDESKLDDKGCNGAPDWVIEVVSPASRRMDYMIKLFKYRTAGVREYWIVEPSEHTVIIYRFDGNDLDKYSFSEGIKSGLIDGLSIDLSMFAE